MKEMNRKLRFARRAVSLALAVALVAALMPMAFAEGVGAESDPMSIVAGDGEQVAEAPEEIEIDLSGDGVEETELALNEGEDAGVAAPAAPEDAAPEPELASNRSGSGSIFGDMLSTLGSGNGLLSNATVKHSVKITQKGATVTIKGSVPSPYKLGGIIVDEQWVSQKMFGASINQKINMNSGKFTTGYHTIVVGIYDGAGNVADLIMKTYIIAIDKNDRKPSYKGRYEVYSNYFYIYPFEMTAFGFTDPRLYLEYSGDGGKTWKRSGYMKAGGIKLATEECYKISGLKPDTTYKTRLRYGIEARYPSAYYGDDETYVFFGPALKSTTVKTGKSAKPSVQSVSLKATNVKYHKVKHYGPYTGVYLYTEKFYTCKMKVTVNLKKKPGTKGLWITVNEGFGHTKFVSGNKTSYTFTFTPHKNYYSKKPQNCNLKYTVSVRSGYSKSWGGYSPEYSISKKVS